MQESNSDTLIPLDPCGPDATTIGSSEETELCQNWLWKPKPNFSIYHDTETHINPNIVKTTTITLEYEKDCYENLQHRKQACLITMLQTLAEYEDILRQERELYQQKDLERLMDREVMMMTRKHTQNSWISMAVVWIRDNLLLPTSTSGTTIMGTRPDESYGLLLEEQKRELEIQKRIVIREQDIHRMKTQILQMAITESKQTLETSLVEATSGKTKNRSSSKRSTRNNIVSYTGNHLNHYLDLPSNMSKMAPPAPPPPPPPPPPPLPVHISPVAVASEKPKTSIPMIPIQVQSTSSLASMVSAGTRPSLKKTKIPRSPGGTPLRYRTSNYVQCQEDEKGNGTCNNVENGDNNEKSHARRKQNAAPEDINQMFMRELLKKFSHLKQVIDEDGSSNSSISSGYDFDSDDETNEKATMEKSDTTQENPEIPTSAISQNSNKNNDLERIFATPPVDTIFKAKNTATTKSQTKSSQNPAFVYWRAASDIIP